MQFTLFTIALIVGVINPGLVLVATPGLVIFISGVTLD